MANPSWKRLYGTTEWRRSREFTIEKDEHLCQVCGTATIPGHNLRHPTVDHIIPHRGDEELFFDLDNLQLLCASCHNVKSNSERLGIKPNYGTTLEGWPVEEKR